MILDGKIVALSIYEDLKNEISKLGKKPKLLVILVGNNSSSLRYIKQKEKWAKYVGIDFELMKFDENIKKSDLLKEIKKLNNDKNIDGYIIQLPLPKNIDEKEILNAVDYKKDVDGFHPINQGKIVVGDNSGLIPCTPKGIIELLNYYKIDIIGQDIVILGKSNIVGKPIANLLINSGATVTICNSKTTNIEFYTKNAKIIIIAIGKVNFLTTEKINPNTIIIDVGFSVINDKIYGDADFENIIKNGNKITPVPGGVGVLTVACLMQNTLKAYYNQNNY